MNRSPAGASAMSAAGASVPLVTQAMQVKQNYKTISARARRSR